MIHLGAEEQQTIDRVVDEVVGCYRKRAPWASAADMRQEAWTAAWWAAQKWNPERGPLAPLANVAARRWVAAWVIKSSSPVSISHGARHKLIGTKGRTTETMLNGGRLGVSTDETIEDREWRVRVVARLLEVAAETGAASVDELIARLGSRRRLRREVQSEIDRTMAKLADDDELRALWEERNA